MILSYINGTCYVTATFWSKGLYQEHTYMYMYVLDEALYACC